MLSGVGESCRPLPGQHETRQCASDLVCNSQSYRCEQPRLLTVISQETQGNDIMKYAGKETGVIPKKLWRIQSCQSGSLTGHFAGLPGSLPNAD